METPKKILFFDLDGTLLRDDKTLSRYTLEVVSKCKERGFLIGISTSRGELNCLKFLGELKPDILISSSGALVRADGKTIYASSFSAAETKRFIETARNICGLDCEITVDTLEAHYWNYKIDPKEQDKSWGDSIYTDFSDFNREALKICVEIPNSDLAQKLSESFPWLDNQHFSDGDWYKYTKSGITKEKAIMAVCEEYHIDVSETIAFGDDYADIGMLKLCGIGVAMGNAIQEVKDVADAITLSNEEDGVAAYLEKMDYFKYMYEQTKYALKQEIKELFAGDCSGHDYWHSLRVLNTAEKIAKTEECNQYIVMIAALLHDTDDRKIFGTKNHENARQIMADCHLTADITERVIDVIREISFKGTETIVPKSIEGKIVQDADRLDAMGAIGIARAFSYGGNHNRPIHIPDYQPIPDMNETEYRNHKGTTINHFHEKLLLLKDRMNTDCAKSIAGKRDEYMREFLKEFQDEWSGL